MNEWVSAIYVLYCHTLRVFKHEANLGYVRILRSYVYMNSPRAKRNEKRHGTDSRVNYLALFGNGWRTVRNKSSPIKFNKCYIGMIDHSINLYFQINLFHNVSAPMSFHFLCSAPYSFDVVLYTLYLFCMFSESGSAENMATERNYSESFFPYFLLFYFFLTAEILY